MNKDNTVFQNIMEYLSLLFIVVSFGYIVISWNNIPQRVPMHYNFLGEIDRMGGKGVILLWPFVGVFDYIIISGISTVISSLISSNQELGQKKLTLIKYIKSLSKIVKAEVTLIFLYFTYSASRSLPVHSLFNIVALCLILIPLLIFIIRALILVRKKSEITT